MGEEIDIERRDCNPSAQTRSLKGINKLEKIE